MRTRLTLGTAGLGDAVGLIDRTRSIGRLREVAWEAPENHRSTPRSRVRGRRPTERPWASRATSTVLPANPRASGVAGTRTNRAPSDTARCRDPAGPAWTRPTKPSGTVLRNA